uniref:Uncharacterized protein n=1 Tax=Zea mays TaxID=4577 RepID=B7ZZI1_MAIZE|nr:unknown [Zea mays]
MMHVLPNFTKHEQRHPALSPLRSNRSNMNYPDPVLQRVPVPASRRQWRQEQQLPSIRSPGCCSSRTRTRREVHPLQLQLYLPALDVPEPEDHVLRELAVPPAHVALVGEAVPGARPLGPDDGAVPQTLLPRVHAHRLHQWRYVHLRVSHGVVSAEGVLVEHLQLQWLAGICDGQS